MSEHWSERQRVKRAAIEAMSACAKSQVAS